jgi:hypothetical protein
MFNLVLVNLTPDARAVSVHAHVEQRNVSPEALRALLVNFCEIDPIENAAGETEIRVNVRHERYLLRTEQRKVILYDVNQRDLPAQMLSVGQAMVELDGTAAASRQQAIQQARNLTTAPFMMAAVPPVAATRPATASRPRVAALIALVAVLLAGTVWLGWPEGVATPAGFVPLAAGERGQSEASLIGVYLTGNDPGQHGIVFTGPGDLKLIELAAVEAPRTVYVNYRLGRVEGKLSLVTDQLGGTIEVTAEGNLVYCGETYLRIP